MANSGVRADPAPANQSSSLTTAALRTEPGSHRAIPRDAGTDAGETLERNGDMNMMARIARDGEGIGLRGERKLFVDENGNPSDLYGPDLTKAEPIDMVIKRLAPLRNLYSVEFMRACQESGIVVSVTRDPYGEDHLSIWLPCDGQEVLRIHRYNELIAQLRRGTFRRQEVIGCLNAFGRFVDNQPFGSIEEAAEAYLDVGGRIYVLPDGRCEETLPYNEERMGAEHYDGFPLRRLLQRYQGALRRRGAREALAAYVQLRGTFHEGSQAYVLEREDLLNG